MRDTHRVTRNFAAELAEQAEQRELDVDEAILAVPDDEVDLEPGEFLQALQLDAMKVRGTA